MRISGSKRNWKRVLLTATACLVIAGAGVGVYAGYIYNKANTALKSMAGAPKESPASDKAQLPDAQTQKPFTVMLTAVDSREGSGGSLNTDVMMLVTLNPATHAATVVSIPRDLELRPEKYGLGSHKANYYYAYYSGQDRDTAMTRTKELFSNIFQVPIDYMAVINFDGFRQMVDELGGLEVNVDMDMRYTDSEDGTNINLKQGLQMLDGKNTLDFLRYRKSNGGSDESSDIERNERQQIVLGKLIDKLTSLGGISSWGGLLDIAGKNLKTDIPEDTLRDWIYSFRSMKPDTIEFLHLDGRWDSPYIVVKEEDVVQAMDALRKRAELPGEASSGTASVDRNYASVIGLDTDSKRTVSRTGAGSKDSDSGNNSTSSITGRVYDKSNDSPPANAQKQGRSSTVKESTYQKR